MLLERGRKGQTPEIDLLIIRENTSLFRRGDFVDNGLRGGARIFRS
jgi:hypothetical protein